MKAGVAKLGLVALLSCGCSGEDIDESGGQALWQMLQDEDYQQWQAAPGYEQPKPTVRAHGSTARVYVNDVVETALADSGLDEWPTGSLLAKDSFDGSGTRTLVAALQKRDDGWYFAEWSASGEVKYAGSPEVCINCHQAGNDWVLSVALP